MNETFLDEFKEKHGIQKDQVINLNYILLNADKFDPRRLEESHFLRDRDPRYDSKNKYIEGSSILDYFFPNKLLEVINLFLTKQGASLTEIVNEPEEKGNSPLLLAIELRDFDIAVFLVDKGANVEGANVDGSEFPLMKSVSVGSYNITRFLLEMGADQNRSNCFGWTPLHRAVSSATTFWSAPGDYRRMESYYDISVLLMKYLANLELKTDKGMLPVHFARGSLKRLIQEEPRRRMDEAPGKRAIEQDCHPNAAISASAQQDDEEEEDETINKQPVAGKAEKGVVADEDQDSEPSSDEEDKR